MVAAAGTMALPELTEVIDELPAELSETIILETAVGRGVACVTFVAWQGTTTKNSDSPYASIG